MPYRLNRQPVVLGPVLVGVAALLLLACREPAGPPPTLEAGVVSFSYAGRLTGSFTADGRCYASSGYPAADSACAVAMEWGDTLRVRAVLDPRTIRWRHVNVDFPEAGTCDDGPCRIGFDFLSAVGGVEQSYRAPEATITVLETAGDRIRGTFSGRAHVPDGGVGDTIRIFDGTFDVPLDR